MAEGNGAAAGRLQQQLDDCLARMRRGDSLERCLEEYAGNASQLRPLLELASRMLDAVVAPPPASRGLAEGRERLRSAMAAGMAAKAADAAAAGPTARPTVPFPEALDEALAGWIAGANPRDILSARPELSDLLAPLLETAAHLRKDLEPPPPPDGRLAFGRRRFLATAAALRSARVASESANPATLEELDLALAAGRGDIHKAATPVAGLVGVARELEANLVSVPPPPAGLADGRAAFLAAARKRAASSPRPADTSARHGRLLDFFVPRRLLLTAAAALAAVVVANFAVLAPASAEALPGQTLYPVKRLNEQLALALTFDPGRRDALQANLNQRRADEIEASRVAGAQGSTDLDARLVRAWHLADEDVANAAEPGRMIISTVNSDDEPITTTLAWNEKTRLDLGDRFENLLDVPPSSDVHVVLTLRGDKRLPLTRELKLLHAAEAKATPDPATPEPVETRASTATRPRPTTTPTSTPPDSPTPPPTPTVTFTPAASATPLPPTPVAQKLDTLDVLKGVLESSPADAVWTVRATTDAARVAVDVARLDNLPADLAAGQAVELEGRWKGSARFMAEHLRRYGPALCTRGEVQGRVARIGGGELVLEGGEYFVERADRPPEAANGPAAVGARVRVVFEQCTAIRYLVSVEVIDAPTPAPSQVVGRVNTVADGELRLSGIAGRPMDFEALVRFDPATVQLSGPGPLAPGAVVAATGQWESDTVFRATALEIRRPAPTPAAPTPSLTPPATTPTPGGLGAPVGSPTPPEAVAPEPVGPALIGPRR